MIDYYFPPLAGAGAQRTLGFVKHLAQFGWRPIILTVHSGDHNFYDASLLERIPKAVDVQRTASFEPLKVARRLFAKPYTESNRYGPGLHKRMGPLRRAVRRLRRLEDWLFFPDRSVGWLPFAVARALRISRGTNIDLVFSTSTAITSHVIAYLVKTILGKPWVADFQDAWAEHPTFAGRLFPSHFHASMARRLEGLILQNSDYVIVTADPLRQTFERRGGKARPRRVAVIPMGYEPAAFETIRPLQRPKFTITHFGNFYASRSPRPFLEGLGKCVRQHAGLAENLDVLFLGTFDPALRDLALNTIDRWGLHDVVHLEGAVPYESGLRLLMSSDVLLIIGDSSEWHRSAIPAKLFEYLGARKPILALLPDGPAAEVLREADAGLLVPPDDDGAIAAAIWDLYQHGRNGQLTFRMNQRVADRFAWSTLAGRLASTFDQAFAARTPGDSKPKLRSASP